MLPILLIVGLLCLSVSPVSPDLLLSFFLGSILIIVGMGIFTLRRGNLHDPHRQPHRHRADQDPQAAADPAGQLLLLGFAITVAEPDLQVLAETVPAHRHARCCWSRWACGVGFFLAVCMVRIILGIQAALAAAAVLRRCLCCWPLFPDADFLSVAFDSGGVTTGPMTVPFILALGVGVSNIRSDRKRRGGQLRSGGAVLHRPHSGGAGAGLLLSQTGNARRRSASVSYRQHRGDRPALSARAIPVYLKEMAVALLADRA